MTLTLALLIISAQPMLAPPLPAPTTGFRLLPDEGLASRILAMDQQLRAPAPTWAAPATGVSFGVSALTIGLSVFAVTTRVSHARSVERSRHAAMRRACPSSSCRAASA